MYKCYNCGCYTYPGEKQNKVVLKTRNKTYLNVLKDEKGQPLLGKDKKIQYKETKGTEIVLEKNFCNSCYE